jgi:MoxR-like ATPase
MATLPEIAEAMCKRVAARDLGGARSLAMQMAAKMGAPRGPRIQRAFENWSEQIGAMKHWTLVAEARSPWIPDAVRQAVEVWHEESKFAEALVASGEKVLPLLLSGETRCGKTSSLAGIAVRLGLPLYRFSLTSALGSHIGDSATGIKNAIGEATKQDCRAIWLIDEIDAIAQKRGGNGSAADKEFNSVVAVMLTEIEKLPPGFLFCATTNMVGTIDRAMVARFQSVDFPKWADLPESDRLEFASSHGDATASEKAASYSDVVIRARRTRVNAVLAAARSGKTTPAFAGDNAELFSEATA